MPRQRLNHFGAEIFRQWENARSIGFGPYFTPVLIGSVNQDGKEVLLRIGGFYRECRLISDLENLESQPLIGGSGTAKLYIESLDSEAPQQ